jgi:hypothetical protein
MLEPAVATDWEAFGTLHKLACYEVESLMACRQIALTETAHLTLLEEHLHCAIADQDYERVERFVCLLIRARIEVGEGIETLELLACELAMRDDERADLAEAVCVRLARVLAVKLDGLHRHATRRVR